MSTSAPIAHDEPLSEEAFQRFSLKPAVFYRIQDFCIANRLEKGRVRVLDWGCGRGRTMFWLRDQGYDAYGVDVDPRPIENGRPFARARGLDSEHVLTVLDARGRSAYPDGFFDFTCSDQVFEHVADMDAVAAELARVTRAGGGGIHVFPAKYWYLEGHLGMPFVHWLPKWRLRRHLIRMWIALGVEAKLTAYEGLDARERAEKFYRFCDQNTFYRSAANVRRIFERHGLRVRFDTARGESIRRRLGSLVDRPIAFRVVNWLLINFVSIHLLYEKPATRPGAPAASAS